MGRGRISRVVGAGVVRGWRHEPTVIRCRPYAIGGAGRAEPPAKETRVTAAVTAAPTAARPHRRPEPEPREPSSLPVGERPRDIWIPPPPPPQNALDHRWGFARRVIRRCREEGGRRGAKGGGRRRRRDGSNGGGVTIVPPPSEPFGSLYFFFSPYAKKVTTRARLWCCDCGGGWRGVCSRVFCRRSTVAATRPGLASVRGWKTGHGDSGAEERRIGPSSGRKRAVAPQRSANSNNPRINAKVLPATTWPARLAA